MIGKVKTYFKKGFLMLLVTAMVCSNSGISVLASTSVSAEESVPTVEVSGNSVEEVQTEEPETEEPQVEVSQEETVAEETEVPVWESLEFDRETEGGNSTDVEYIYPEGSASVSGINLNGNSVIIRASANDNPSGTRLINIIIDKDKDGVIDDGEEPVEIDGSTDLMGGSTIYGYYIDSEATEPISITMVSGKVSNIYGVYQSSLTTSGETAVTMRMLGGELSGSGYFYGANQSQIVSTGAPAIEVYMDAEMTSTMGNLAAAYGTRIEVKDCAKTGVYVEMKNGKVGTMNAFNNCSYVSTGCNSTALHVNLTGGTLYSLYAVQNGEIISDGTNPTLIDIDVADMAIPTLYGVQAAKADAGKNTNKAVDIDITGESSVTNYLCGVYGNSSGTTPVTGDVEVDFTPDAGATNNNMSYAYAVTNYVDVDGDVMLNIENAYGSSAYAAYSYCTVSGDVTLLIPEGSKLRSNVCGMDDSKCGGDLTVRVYGCDLSETSTYLYVYGFDGVYKNQDDIVGGDFTLEYLGGRAGYIYPTRGYSSSRLATIGGKAEIKIREGNISQILGLQNTDVAGDVLFAVGDYETADASERKECVVTSQISMSSYMKAKNVICKLYITNTEKDKPNVYGWQDSKITGDFNLDIDGGYYYSINGTQSVDIQGNATVSVKNVNKELENYSNGGTTYLLKRGAIGGNINVSAQDSRFNGLYAVDGCSCGGTVKSEIKNVDVYSYLYGASVGSTAGDVSCTLTDVSANYVYGAQQVGNVGGNITVEINRATVNPSYSNSAYLYGVSGSSSYSAAKDVAITFNDCVFQNSYGILNGAIMGNLVVDINGGTFGSTTTGTHQTFASPTYVKGTSTVTVSDATYYGSVTPYYINSGGCGDATVTVENTKFEAGYYSSESFECTAGENQKLTVTLDEDCTISDNKTIKASDKVGEGTLYYNGEVYYGGAIKFSEDKTIGKVHLAGGSFYIPKDVSVEVEEFYWENGNILLEGTFNANLIKDKNDQGKYPGTVVYRMGGTTTIDLDAIEKTYWPFELRYKAKGGSVANNSGSSSYEAAKHPQGGNRLFAYEGQTIKYTISAVEGYTLASVTYTADGVTNNIPNSGTLYTMTMPGAACIYNVDFQGNQIAVGKTMKDPVLKLNVETTQEAPAYDLGTLSIGNDSEVGSVTYKVDATYGLPEGLSLSGDKIVGTPTVAYESGKRTIIRVTGKNDTYVDLPINFVVTTGNGTQTSQEGRITVDETNQVIYTNGNSVVIGIVENQTAIYIDDDRNGTADYEEPAVVGDYTGYTLYGLRNTDTKTPIRITMNDGTIGTIYGVQNGAVTADGHGLEIYIYGGNVGYACALDNASVSDTMKLMMYKESTVTSSAIVKNSSCSYVGYLYQQELSDGTLSAGAGGTYNFTEDLEADTIVLNKKHLIPEGVTLKAKKLTRVDGAEIRLRGTLLADSVPYNYYGKVFVQGGTLPENCTWDYVYYPVSTTTNIKNTKVTFSTTNSASATLTDDGVSTTYLRAGYTVTATVTEAPGYDYYYSVNGADMQQFTGTTFTFAAPRKISEVGVTYIPKQISIQKLFADPVGEVGKAYTATAPLYDLRGLTLVDDTTANYGGEVKYALKSGSTLPEGLTFEDGRVIGTPTKADMTGKKVTFVVTGRNGTTDTVDVVLKISGEELEEKDINDLVEVSGTTIDLQGTSVVVLEDPLNTSNSQIYIDENQDGTADNNNPLLFGTATSKNLSSYTLKGYADVNSAYEGDITITVKGGNLKSLYGVMGTGSSEKYWAKVNGTVTVNVGDVNMTDGTSVVCGVCRGQAKNVNLNVTDGYYEYTDFYGAKGASVTGNVNYTLAGDLYVSAESTSGNYHVFMRGTEESTIGGNVNIRLAIPDSTCFNSKFYQYSTFTGVYKGSVGGNVVCDVAGYCNTRNWRVLENTKAAGNVTLNLADGVYLDCYGTYSVMSDYPCVAIGSEVTGDTTVNVAENGTFTMYGLYVFHDTDGSGITVNVPVSAKKNISNLTLLTSVGASVTGATFVNQRGVVTIGGTGGYTIQKDLEATGLTLNDSVHVTIPENVTVNTTLSKLIVAEGAKLTNNGTLDVYINSQGNSTGIGGTLINNGVVNTSGYTGGRYAYQYYFPILATGCVINQAGATWNIEGPVYNLGKIVNYGTFNQTYGNTYCYYLGTVYTTEPLNLSWDPATHSNYRSSYITNTSYPYPDFYYPITVEYPSHVLKSAAIAGDAVSTSGIEGDTRQYVRAVHPADSTPTFTVTLGDQTLDTVKLSSVTYGPENALANVQTDGSWIGCAQNIFEPVVVTVNYDAASEETPKITLDKTTDRIENTQDNQLLVYGKTYSYSKPLYDLSTLEIDNDMEGDGQIIYYLDSSSELPKGLSLKDGRLYGTLKQATTADQEITFIVKGRNQTSAFFTLTLGPVAKQVPSWTIPANLSGLIGQTLAEVYLPASSFGTYSWPDATVSLGNEVKTLEDQTLLFTPSDTDNYDWAAAAEKNGVTYADGVIACKVDVQVCAGVPTFTAPETITTTYGKTYGEVLIPAGDNDGKFEWYYDDATPVGKVGTYTRWITYIPNDSNYQTVNYIEVTLVVEKAIPTYKKITSVSQECGSTLADIILPDAEGGKYQWITTATTIPLDGKTYQVGFKPDDTTNYDWSKIEGWNEAWKCVVFPITVNLNHTYSTELTYDETHHWYPCLDETCDSVEGKEEHLWDDGFVLEEATMEEEGVIEYSCECGASYEETIPKLTHPEHVYTGAWKYDSEGHWKQCTYTDCVETSEPEDHEFDEGVAVSAPTTSKKGVVKYTCEICKYTETEYLDEEEWENGGWSGDDEDDEKEEELVAGDEFEDPDTKAEYEVSKTGKEVVFLAPDKKTYTRFTIPKTVEFEGVYYKVTEIAPNAFKGNKKLKSVKIGSNIKTIGARAFYGCSKLTTVTMGSNVTTIGNSAFQNCTSIKKFTIPKKVSKIGSKAFYGCKKLLTMTIKTTKLTEKKVGKSAFSKMGSSNYKKVKVKVPKKKLKTYKKMLVKRGLSKKAKVKK